MANALPLLNSTCFLLSISLALFTSSLTAQDPQTFVVTNTNDAGAGTLRQALEDASTADTITFAPDLSGATILLQPSPLRIEKGLTIDASNLPSRITISPDPTADQERPLLEIETSETVVIDSLTISGGRPGTSAINTGVSGGGVQIALSSSVTLRRCQIVDNRAGDGADKTDPGEPAGVGGNGGGLTIINSTVTFEDCLIANNRSGAGGRHSGGLKDGNSGDGGGISCQNSTLTIRDSTIQDNSTPDGGLGGKSGSGGGIYAIRSSILIERSTISGNITGNGGNGVGGMNSIDPGASGDGGGIYMNNNGPLTVRNSTLYGNRTGDPGLNPGISTAGDGGAIGFIVCNITIESSTITGNRSGIDLLGNANGGIAGTGDIVITCENSIIAGNFDPEDLGTPTDVDIVIGTSTTMIPRGVNLIGINETIETFFPLPNTPGEPNLNGDLVGEGLNPLDPLLGPLANNGGPTETLLPLEGSPAIDPVDSTDMSTFATDQRGFSRIISNLLDIGAVEAPDYVAMRVSAARTAQIAALEAKIKRERRKLRSARKKKQAAKVKRIKRKIKRFTQQLRSL